MSLTQSLWLSPNLELPPRYTFVELLEAACTNSPDDVALVDGGPAEASARQRWTTAELNEWARGAAAQLLETYRPGERVAIWASNRPEWEIIEFGAAMAGLVVVAVNPALSAREATLILRKSGAAGVVVERTYRGTDLHTAATSIQEDLPDLRRVHALEEFSTCTVPASTPLELPKVRPDDPAMILYTSGTTGFPKGAVLTHGGLVSNATLFARRFGLGRGSVWVNPMPMFHLGGCSFGALGALSSGGVHVVHNFDPQHTLALTEQERATFLPLVPTMAVSMMDHPSFATTNVGSVTILAGGSTTIPAALVDRMERCFDAYFGAIYGQTECAGVICQSTTADSTEDKTQRVGRPLGGTDVKIVDPSTGDLLAAGEVGELCVRSADTFVEYFDEPDETATTKDTGRWVHTGDLGRIDERGFVQVTGRLKDMIVRGGENIYAREIEDLLYEHDIIAEVAVLGVPDYYYGEQVAAFVCTRGDAALDSEKLCAWLRGRLASSKVPRYWVRVDAIPTTSSGKFQKFALREQFLRGDYEIVAEAPFQNHRITPTSA